MQPVQASEHDENNIPGLAKDGCSYFIRICTLLLFAGTILINYLLGVKTGVVSDKYHLFVTPPAMFFSIWAFIFCALGVVTIYNLIKNEWTKDVYLWFALTNIQHTLWILVFNIGNNAAVFACSFIIIILVPFILKTWYVLGDRPQSTFNKWTYITRNVFAFYLGWVIAAANINLGIIIVYWWNGTKQAQLAVFWVITPLCAIGVTVLNYVKEGKRGLLCCFMLWASVVWAFIGAAITSNGCLSNTLTLC